MGLRRRLRLFKTLVALAFVSHRRDLLTLANLMSGTVHIAYRLRHDLESTQPIRRPV